MDANAVVLLVGVALALPLIARALESSRRDRNKSNTLILGSETFGSNKLTGPKPEDRSGLYVLLAFAGIIVVVGITTFIRYYAVLRTHADDVYFVLWLFLTMLFGMFANVLASNRNASRPFFSVTASQLLFPPLFSVIVFYPIWIVAASAPRGTFSFYTAFLNGFFWQTIVTATKPPRSSL